MVAKRTGRACFSSMKRGKGEGENRPNVSYLFFITQSSTFIFHTRHSTHVGNGDSALCWRCEWQWRCEICFVERREEAAAERLLLE